MHALITALYPICRSITGNGVRSTLEILKRTVPLTINEVPSGTKVFDWEVPPEWNITDAYIKNAAGERVVDFNRSNLHVVNYSRPVHKQMTWEELKPFVHSLADRPDAIPYRTTYYEDKWGFCVRDSELSQFKSGETYDVCIDSTYAPGNLTYGEYVVKGSQDAEILISTHICHPSMCNDNLSGIAVASELANWVASMPRKYSYRFLFIPGTIGSLTWLATHEADTEKIKFGLVLTGVGDAGAVTYKKTRQGNTEIDYVMERVLKARNTAFKMVDFYPYGYDERQYSSPGIHLPVGTLMRTQHGTYPEYHTSKDNLSFVKPESLADSLAVLTAVLETVETAKTYINTSPKGEPNLGKRGLYAAMNTQTADKVSFQMAMLWVLNLSDGTNSLTAIATRSGMDMDIISSAANVLHEHELLKEVL